jgi:F0F1-type ATP synthase assembly protein I
MSARVPLDVDLEDKLLYGLTPTRLVYLVVALLAAFALWSGSWAIAPIRGAAAALLVAVGAVAAWGRWRGRPADRWVTDAALFVLATYRVRWRR